MLRIIASIVIQLIANAVGLIVANLVLDDMSLNASGFLLAVGIFTLIEVVIQPLIVKMAMSHASALIGSSALIASFIALVVTTWLSDGLQISGFVTWLLATAIVWGAGLLAVLLLPMIIFKKTMRGSQQRR